VFIIISSSSSTKSLKIRIASIFDYKILLLLREPKRKNIIKIVGVT